MRIKRYLTIIFIFLLGLVLGLTWNTHRKQQPHAKYDEIDEMIKLIEDYSYYFDNEEITRQLLLEGALRGIVDELGDPHSVYLDEEELKRFTESINANFAGAGILISQTGDYSLIVDVIEDSPADGKLQNGDVLLAVDGVSVVGLNVSEMGDLIRGAVGTERTITVYRQNELMSDEHTVDVIITLDHVSMHTVYHHVITTAAKKIGYIKVTNFANNTFEAFRDAFQAMSDEELTDIIIDVRDNPGGSLNTVKDMMDLLTDKNEPLLYVKDRNGDLEPHEQNRYHALDYNFYILINENSASASEVFAATLHELKGVPLIGTTSYGKGTVQALIYLGSDRKSAVKLTINDWLTPNKRSIQDVGVAPTVEVPFSSPFGYLDYNLQIEYNTVNLEAIYLQRFLNRTRKIDVSIREDGYIDEATIDAVKQYQLAVLGGVQPILERELGILDFETIYYMNRDIIKLSQRKEFDRQLQKAIELILRDEQVMSD